MCIGELHEESTRNFLAEEFFAKLSTDVLLLEVTPKDLKHITKWMDAGRDYFPLLDADIMSILGAVTDRNSAIKIRGIERKSFVIPDTRALHPHIYELFQLLRRQTFEKYGSLIVFRISYP
jgi:hypothetical protein